MLMIDGYIVNYNNRNRFYGIDEMHEAMARAVLYDGVLVRLSHETITGEKYYDSYDFKSKCWVDEFDINKICDAADTKWNINASPTQSGWYLATIENEVGKVDNKDESWEDDF